MIRFRRFASLAFAVAILGSLLSLPAGAMRSIHAQAPPGALQGPQTWAVLVDNVSPQNHVWGFDTYYPNNLQAHAGDTITFNTALNPNAFHTVALLRGGVTPEAGFPGLIAPDDDEPGKVLFPFFADEPATPCGRVGQSACSFDGKVSLNSGIIVPAPPPEAGGGHGNPSFAVTLGSGIAPGTYFFECYVHGPLMSGSVDVLPRELATQSAADVKADADRQYQSDLKALSDAEVAISIPTTARNGDGTTTWTVAAGGGAHMRVTVNEFGVKQLIIKAGDTVNWTMQSANEEEIHTVTGFSTKPGEEPPQADAFDIACGRPGGQDTFAPEQGFPLDFWNTCPGREESHPTQYAAPSAPSGSAYTGGLVNSGIMVSPSVLNIPPPPGGPMLPPPATSYGVKFPQPGLYNYHCTIHQGMDATVVVLPAQ